MKTLRKEIKMNPVLTQALYQLGMILIFRLINSDKDTSELEAKIAAAATEEELKEIAIIEVVNNLVGDLGYPAAKIAVDLVNTGDTVDVVDIITKPENKLNILQGLANLVGNLLSALFGKK